MPTIITHAAIPLALGVTLGSRKISRPLLAAGMVAAMMPDLDVIAFRLGMEYADQFGHRGATHSIALALALGGLAALIASRLRAKPWVAMAFVFTSCVSHPLLDMCTTGGLGVALWWPFSDQRLFFPMQFIRVSPLTLDRFMGPAGIMIIRSEFLWVWLPCFALMLAAYAFRTRLPNFHTTQSGVYRPIDKKREMVISIAAIGLAFAWHFAGDRRLFGAITLMSLITIGRYSRLGKTGPDGDPIVSAENGTLLFTNPGFMQLFDRIPLADIEQVKVYGPKGNRFFRVEFTGRAAKVYPTALNHEAEQAVISFLRKLLPERVVVARAPDTFFEKVRGR